MRLIDADKLREHWLENGRNEKIYDTNDFLNSIDEQETVDAESVRYGKWVFVEPGAVWCSECGMDSSLCDAETTDETKRRIANGETPNCGAKMDLGVNYEREQ